MENELPVPQAEDGRSSRRGRLMGKLFGKDKRPALDDETGSDLDDFFQKGGGDALHVSHPAPAPAPPLAPGRTAAAAAPGQQSSAGPPRLAKLDTTSHSRYPQALNIDAQQSLAYRTRSHSPQQRSPRPNKKGLVVRFADTYPEIIGEGGDETQVPVIEIGKRRREMAAVARPVRRKPLPSPSGSGRYLTTGDERNRPEEPSSLAVPRSPTGSVTSEERDGSQSTIIPGRAASARYLESTREKDENRRSFIEIHSAQMREAEGQAFAQAARTVSAASNRDWDEQKHIPLHESPPDTPERPRTPESQARRPPVGDSPASARSVHSNHRPLADASLAPSRQGSTSSQMVPPPSFVQQPSFQNQEETSMNEAFDIFVSRVRHLFELFRLHAETVMPLSACALHQLARAALWWFLKGRSALEIAIRERPVSPKDQMQCEMDKQQANANLAKGYWLCDQIIPEVATSRAILPDAEITDVTKSLIASLKKLALSMKRNGFLPPEDAFLPQTIDKSVWVEYPKISQDLVSLLNGRWDASPDGSQREPTAMEILEATPLSDTTEVFSFGRIQTDVILMEQGGSSSRLHFPCFLSMVRHAKQMDVNFIVASQNGDVQLRISDNKNTGPTMADVRWRHDDNALEVRLRRGYQVVIRCTQKDYRMLWSMVEFGRKLELSMRGGPDEEVTFKSTLKAFQYFDADPQSRTFPKEPVPHCNVAVFEKLKKESANGMHRTHHRGFRVAVVTGSGIRMLCGVQHTYLPGYPIQFAFVRGEGGAPALILRYDSGRSKGRMVFTFNEERDRFKFHTRLCGTAMHPVEKLFADVPLGSFAVSERLQDAKDGIAPFSRLPWQGARVVNEEHEQGDGPITVASDRLRVVMDFKLGTLTDRINVAPGELRIRLEVSNPRMLRVYRQAQQDLTVAASESQVSRELPKKISDGLKAISYSETIRSYGFPELKHLHEFQAALTGFSVLYDGFPASFSISRRRMVVPIYKRWEATAVRLQVVRNHKDLQMLVFFDNFSHARCMNFALKGTDSYEAFHRGGKSGLKIVDAKFPLPHLEEDGAMTRDEGAFVCLDLPDLPGEHDDISMSFEDEKERDMLVSVLPASVKGSARLSRMK